MYSGVIDFLVCDTLSASSVSDSLVMYMFEEVILNDLTKTIGNVKNLVIYFKKHFKKFRNIN